MKFSVKKKLNLSRIDKELWPYEDEVYEAIDADSLDEAQKVVDVYYAEREGFFRAVSEARKAERNKQATLPLSGTITTPARDKESTPISTPLPAPLEPPVPGDTALPPTNPVVTTPGAPDPVDSGVSNLPPKEFN